MKNRFSKDDLLVVITGPIASSGRSGKSWGVSRDNWDVVEHDALDSIRDNSKELNRLGISCAYFGWKHEESRNNELSTLGIEINFVSDPFWREIVLKSADILRVNAQNNYESIKESSQNDQRQWFLAELSFLRAAELGFKYVIRIRSDQKLNMNQLIYDFSLAVLKKKLFFPAQKDFIELDLDYTGFCILDFFLGGSTNEMLELVQWVRLGGRLDGPHQDLTWKPLLHNKKWLERYPGLSTLSNLSDKGEQESRARYFWREIAHPSSAKLMDSIKWRGEALRKIEYKVSIESFGNTKINSNLFETTSIPKDLITTNFYWNKLSHYLTGIPLRDSNQTNSLMTKLFYDHLKFIVIRMSPLKSMNFTLSIVFLILTQQLRRFKGLYHRKTRVKKVRKTIKNVNL